MCSVLKNTLKRSYVSLKASGCEREFREVSSKLKLLDDISSPSGIFGRLRVVTNITCYFRHVRHHLCHPAPVSFRLDGFQ